VDDGLVFEDADAVGRPANLRYGGQHSH